MTPLHQVLIDFSAFEATPGISMIVLPDAPLYTYVAVSDDFIRASGFQREDVIGRSHFEVFPQDTNNLNSLGACNVSASFEYILKNKVPHELSIQPYNFLKNNGSFAEKFWKIKNAPILSKDGQVQYIVHSAIDVTDLAKSNEQEKQTTQFLIDHSPHGFVIYNAMRDEQNAIIDFRINSYNKKANELTGFTSQEREKLTFLQILRTLGVLSAFDRFVAVVEKGKDHSIEQPITRTGKWICYSVTKYKDGFLATLVDITELKHSQQQLQKEIVLSNGIFNASLNGIYVLEAIRDKEGKITDFILVRGNQRFSELTGWPIETVTGKSFLSSFPLARNGGLFEMLCQVLESGQSHREATYYAQTFQRWYDYIAVRMGENNIVITFQEITQIRETAMQLEQQKTLLNNIMHHSPSGIAVYTALRNKENKIVDFQCVLANHTAEVFTQIPTRERLSKTVLEITPGLEKTPLFEMAVSAIETSKPFQTQYHHAAMNKWLELSVVKMDEDHLINVFADITAVKEVQAKLESSIEELKMSNAELEQFAFVSSHDLQEPLRKIRTFSNIASEQVESGSSARKYLEKIDDAAKRMSGLISSLLEYSRLTSGSQRMQQVDLSYILDNVLTDFELLISEKNAIIQSGKLPEIEANPLQINQLFFNLIGNALKFTRRNVQPVISIESEPLTGEKRQVLNLPEHKEYIQLTIKDNGIGFNQEYAQKIFVIFQRLNDRSTFGGYGIGLAVCKKIVDTHQGIITATGKPQEGTTFTIILPVKQR